MSTQPLPAPIASTICPCPTIIQICRTPQHLKFTQHLSTTQPPPNLHDWLVGCFGLNGLLRQYFSLYQGRLPERGRKKREMIDERKNVQTTPTRTYCKRNRPLPYFIQISRTPRHWKVTQHLCTTQPPPNLHEM